MVKFYIKKKNVKKQQQKNPKQFLPTLPIFFLPVYPRHTYFFYLT